MTGNQCTISIDSDANAGNWINVDDLTFTSGSATGLSVKGSDISSPRARPSAASTGPAPGTTGDALAILKSAGMNYARLKVCATPPTVTTTRRASWRWPSASRRRA